MYFEVLDIALCFWYGTKNQPQNSIQYLMEADKYHIA